MLVLSKYTQIEPSRTGLFPEQPIRPRRHQARENKGPGALGTRRAQSKEETNQPGGPGREGRCKGRAARPLRRIRKARRVFAGPVNIADCDEFITAI